MNYSQKIIAFTLLTAFIALFSRQNVYSDDGQQAGDVFNNFSDVLIYILPSVAFGMTLGARDGEGALQLAESAAASMGVTVVLKYTVDSTRPNGDPQSFPSGHTAITVTSAEFMRKRYGWRYGLPAYLVSAYVGYDRIRTDQHYVRDVVAGAAISFTCTTLITKPYKGWTIQPVVVGKVRGIRITRSL